jgi:hypothetical protein
MLYRVDGESESRRGRQRWSLTHGCDFASAVQARAGQLAAELSVDPPRQRISAMMQTARRLAILPFLGLFRGRGVYR